MKPVGSDGSIWTREPNGKSTTPRLPGLLPKSLMIDVMAQMISDTSVPDFMIIKGVCFETPSFDPAALEATQDPCLRSSSSVSE